MRLGSTRRELRAEIDACGYFPELVEDTIMEAVGDEDLVDFVVHHEPTFDRDEIHRHVTILALTPSRLIVGHTDDHPAEPPMEGTFAAASTESVLLPRLNSVVLTRVVARPAEYRTGSPDVTETMPVRPDQNVSTSFPSAWTTGMTPVTESCWVTAADHVRPPSSERCTPSWSVRSPISVYAR